MKKKVVTLIFAVTLITTSLFSQTVKQKIDKQIKDPKTAENSAKADVYIQKKMIRDSGLVKKNNQPLLSKREDIRRKHRRKTSN